jgi:hypothetical protein
MTTLDTPRTRTQNDEIRDYLLTGQEITALVALDRYGCFRLASRIHDLKQQGMDIVDRRVKTPGGAVIKAYRLATHQYELV